MPLMHQVDPRQKLRVIPHPSKQDTLPIVFLITKQAVPYQARGGTYCPVVSTPKIQSLTDLRTTSPDGLNHLHHSNPFLKPQHRTLPW
jgi:hypothetical protein